jgi:hypothetical protein
MVRTNFQYVHFVLDRTLRFWAEYAAREQACIIPKFSLVYSMTSHCFLFVHHMHATT